MGLRLDQRLFSKVTVVFAALVLSLFNRVLVSTTGSTFNDAVHITAIVGESVVFNCQVEFPAEHPVPYVLQWEKKGLDIPIFIWYDNYPTHSGSGYEGRVARVSQDSPYGLASLNLTNIQESDQGWYACKVVFLNRSPTNKNGTWFHLDVHAPPKFVTIPGEVQYINVGDSIILNCQAVGTPTPEIVWFKDATDVQPTTTVGIFNDGTELRISNIRTEDIGDYTCIARNGEGQISHTARVLIAGGAVIMSPPTNQTKLEGEKVEFTCGAKAMPGNVTVRWSRDGAFVKSISSLETRVTIKKDGSMVINPVSADDSGQYLCEVSNGIGDPQSASAYLNVEYPAKVTFTPTVQYLPFRLAGVVQCYIKANPPLQYVTWTKDKRLLEPYQQKDIVIMNNGSLLFTRVNQNHQGRYTCTPYNAQGTQGSSGQMEVLVRKPPTFTVEPENMYQRKISESVEMHCDAQEAEGTQKPKIQWQRRDGAPLPKGRHSIHGGNITIENLRKTDFGYYHCVASNEVATIVTTTHLVVEGTQPHAPYNVSANASETTVTLQWLPGYSGGPDYKQDYTIWYKEPGMADWSTIPVTPSGSTQVTINRLTPDTTYEFQVVGKNALGDGMLSKVISIKTLAAVPLTVAKKTSPAPPVTELPPPPSDDVVDYSDLILPTESSGATLYPPVFRPKGPKPGPPRNVSIAEVKNGFVISWQAPLERAHLVRYYVINYKTDGIWRTLNKAQIRAEDDRYLVKSLVGGRTYYFRVVAYSLKSFENSEEIKFPVPARVKHKAITAGVVGGLLFFIVAIILSVCAVKICNKRKRRKHEKAYNMVACRITDARNGGQIPGTSQVPLKKSRSTRISSLSSGCNVVLNMVARPSRSSSFLDRGGQDCVDGLPGGQRPRRRLGRISRSADGRFVLTGDSGPSSRRGSGCSSSGSSDDGGFLSHPSFSNRTWSRQPLLTVSGSSGGGGGDGPRWTEDTVVDDRRRPIVVVATVCDPRTPYGFDRSTAPAGPGAADDRTTLQSVHERYSQQLPSLRAIHEENHRTLMRRLQPASPRYHPNPGRYRSRHMRYARSAPELTSDGTAPVNNTVSERSPESRSSSSGFGSKNTTSSVQHQNAGAASVLDDWCGGRAGPLPPYKHPPPPPPPHPSSLFYADGRWLDFGAPHVRLPSSPPLPPLLFGSADSCGSSTAASDKPPLSVDDQYEFDPVFPLTPTPTELLQQTALFGPTVTCTPSPSRSRTPTQLKKAKYDSVEARLRAMKEEFHAYKRRQAQMAGAMRHQHHSVGYVESAC
ncbi:protein turtle-like isoform X1 [Metopolophium dirhodum]|uniref:protein turtle-like isoform X1 n=1 Tax=Metopolophium dirhodum TaxID=44670 RepID=UPI00298FEE70|nr:protein turtle-like isoform X1 [Metopolophium dirhodum]XP_060868692.1 protein turtle-like isoform X1 [Metopolophium dirhodum]XP_060868693.1 protein turtle-like isoform X1 [Metopolophium dirhodum]